ncbi:hypothetical protein [Tenacibaculum maritimum]|uniref:hypothetical protein n=4 Tax=Tenacibaculum maritimum TaxID=107401 RepID=UPI0012E428AB|nr:hypothetical protein [Tenacibaculum maritimum]CAA0158914.1 conserved exported hypothetical protein [Tenacibaculum maritimum]CAA0162898.1 conserved exported hypothetical protein [Tenacibaculum maritimum]CAA0165072.1 conserved exported hypothetical protein [Tenacibaculum maritimum]CAA0212869.1 conserved exported hypothetical protein [Tenacibaculum maritimum]
MKLKVLLLLLITFQSYSQVSVGRRHVGKSKKFKKGVLEKFKNTETIFLLSNIYEKEVYEKILKDSWNVTPYKVVDLESFEIENYLSSKYSVAQLAGLKRSGGGSTSLFTYIDFKIYDSDAIFKKLEKLSPKKRKKKKQDIINKNSSNIARFYIFPKDDFIRTSLSSDIGKIVNSLFTDDVFFNYKPGFLKNYFQKINNLIKNEDIYWMYEDDYLPELKKLTNNKLYIPSYMTIKYSGWMGQDSEEDDENIKDIFRKYDYGYEIVSDEEISNKILNNEEFYYLRYVRMNTERFLQVVNSKTGEIIYRDYIMGLSYRIKSKHIKKLSRKIKKVSKK